MEITSKVNITKFKNGEKICMLDEVVNETELTLSINFKNLATLTCSPSDLEDLTAGYLLTSGIATEENPLESLEFDKAKNIMHITLKDNTVIKDMIFSRMRPVGCGAGDLLFSKGKPLKEKGSLRISKVQVSSLMNEFNKASEIFLRTGGVHSAAVSDGEKILVMREDIGRHNAIDKSVGNIYLAREPLNDKIVLTSGRISSEIVLKLIFAGVGIVISRSAPTLRAIELAKGAGLTVIGFARSINFNVYSGFEKVSF